MFYLNGKYQTTELALSVLDRGFLLGDGVFTTLKYADNILHHFDDHINRLNNDAAKIYLECNLNKSDLRNICTQVLKENNLENSHAIIRITLTRGVGGRGVNFPIKINPTLLVWATAYQDLYPEALKICTTTVRRNADSILSNIKSLNYLEQSLSRYEALHRGYDDGVMLNNKGFIAECSAANIFFITNENEVVTPPVSDGVLPGIIRNKTIRLCYEFGIPIFEKSVTIADVKYFVASFITNCVIGIKKIKQFDGTVFNTSNSIVEKIVDLKKLHTPIDL